MVGRSRCGGRERRDGGVRREPVAGVAVTAFGAGANVISQVHRPVNAERMGLWPGPVFGNERTGGSGAGRGETMRVGFTWLVVAAGW
jgi:hypothetical protein